MAGRLKGGEGGGIPTARIIQPMSTLRSPRWVEKLVDIRGLVKLGGLFPLRDCSHGLVPYLTVTYRFQSMGVEHLLVVPDNIVQRDWEL